VRRTSIGHAQVHGGAWVGQLLLEPSVTFHTRRSKIILSLPAQARIGIGCSLGTGGRAGQCAVNEIASVSHAPEHSERTSVSSSMGENVWHAHLCGGNTLKGEGPVVFLTSHEVLRKGLSLAGERLMVAHDRT